RDLRRIGCRASLAGASQAAGAAGRGRQRGEPSGPLLCVPPPPSTLRHRMRGVGEQETWGLPQLSDAAFTRAADAGRAVGGDQGSLSGLCPAVEAGLRTSACDPIAV